MTFIRRWGPPILVMLVIFAASARPKAALPDFGGYDWLAKKSGHVLIYATLALSFARALSYGRTATARDFALAVVLAGLYGATDEFHQTFVLGRGATALDVLIDSAGATLGVLAGLAWRRAALGGRRPGRPAGPAG